MLKNIINKKNIIKYKSFSSITLNNLDNDDILAHDIYHNKNNNSNNNNDNIIFLHGILGNKKNWRKVNQEFVKKFPNYNSIALDHRGHGNSSAITNHYNNTIDDCVIDITSTINNINIQPKILCGHSFSGKVVLKTLEYWNNNNNISLPEHVWLLDSLPGKYNDIHLDNNSISKILLELYQLPLSVFPNKEWITNYLLQRGYHSSIVQWITSHLIPVNPQQTRIGKGPVQFSFSIDIIIELFEDYCKLDAWEYLENYDNDKTIIHFIRAGNNPLWTDEVIQRFDKICSNNSNIKLHTMSNVGHWLHTEDVHGMINIISKHSQLQSDNRNYDNSKYCG